MIAGICHNCGHLRRDHDVNHGQSISPISDPPSCHIKNCTCGMSWHEQEFDIVIRCLECHYWHMTVDSNGECRRYAPRPTVTGITDDQYRDWTETRRYGIILWPETDEDDWCGEFGTSP